jgi:cation-transporting P-type ATPase C
LEEYSTASIVLWLLNLGEYMELLIMRRTRAAIRGLLSDDNPDVWVLADGGEVEIPLKDVRVDQRVAVRSGRRIAIDGIIECGDGTINEAAVTGESVPVIRTAGDKVYAGTVLLAGSLVIRVTEVGSATVIGRLIERVEGAQTLRPEIQLAGDRFASFVVPAAFLSALLVLLITRDPRRSLTMLLVACPCAAGLATPTAMSASIGNSARRGMLIKGGKHIEAMAGADTFCFDKTGTLTESELTIQHVVSCKQGYSEERILHLAVHAESQSQHPFALAIVKKAGCSEGFAEGSQFENIPGRGVRCLWEQNEVLVGSRKFLSEQEVKVSARREAMFPSRLSMESIVYVAHQKKLVGIIGVVAAMRPEAHSALENLRQAGIKNLVMLTGDVPQVAEQVADEAGITQWLAGLMPNDKLDAIQALRHSGHGVAMVGDGINDAPALAASDVGIALGAAGSDVAIETADIALASDDLRHVADVLWISRRTMTVVRQNYALALGVNGLGVMLAAVGAINPLLGAVLHNLSTVLVTLNSSRLLNYDPTKISNMDKREAQRDSAATKKG